MTVDVKVREMPSMKEDKKEEQEERKEDVLFSDEWCFICISFYTSTAHGTVFGHLTTALTDSSHHISKTQTAVYLSKTATFYNLFPI